MALTKVTGDFIETGSITQGHLHSSHGITTSHITEGDKLFFTNARVDSRVGSLSTSDLSEGTNLYFTNARAISALTAGTNIAIASNGTISSTDTNTTYTVGDGGLTQNNFTNTLKGKLDGVAASATNVTNTNQLTNGAGFITSADGGNATTLDGIDSSSFLRSDASDTYTGDLVLNGTLNLSGSMIFDGGRTLMAAGTEAQNIELRTASSTHAGLMLANATGAFKMQLYGTATDYGLLQSEWGAWDLRKRNDGELYIVVSGTERSAIHSGNIGSQTVATAGNAGTLDGIDSSQFQRNDTGTLPLARMNTVLPTSGNYVWNNATTAGNYNIGLQTAFVAAAQGFPSYGSVLHVGARGGTDAGGDFQIYCGHGANYGGNYLRVRNADNDASVSDSWTSWRVILDSGNYGSYSTFSGDITWGNGYKLSNGNNSNNAEVLSATTGSAGIVIKDSGGTFKMQLYGEGGHYGLLNAEWGGWDLRKANNGELTIYVSGTGQTAIHTGNIGSQTVATANAVSFGSVTGSSRVGLDLTIKPSSNGYGGFIFQNFAGTHAGYLIMRDTSNAGNIYKANGITLVADLGWLTLAQRTAGSVGVRIMTGTTSLERITVVDSTTTISNQLNAAGNIYLSGGDSHIYGGTITSRAGSRAIEVGYADKSCYISASRTSSNISMIMWGGTSNQNYIWNRASATDSSGRTMVVTRGTNNAFLMNGGSGYVTFYGGHGNSSDRLLKKNIEDSNYGLEAVNNLKPRRFFWKDETVSKQKQIGFIAQEVEEVLPESVRGYEGDKSIIDNSLISVLTKAIQELSQEVTALKAEVESLKE